MEARRQLTVLMGGFAASQMLYVAARLELADLLARGPLTVAELAVESGSRKAPLGRVIRALSAFGIFETTADGRIANTPLSECLRAGGEDSLRDLALVYGEEHYHAMSELLHAVKHGGTAFEHAYRKPHFSYLASNPEAAHAYYETAGAAAARAARGLVAACDFTGARKVVELGGGTGRLLRAVLTANHGLSGVLVETSGMARKARARVHAEGLDDRCEIETGDIFEAVPRGADVYLLGHVLHGLDDERALRLLAACSRAMPAHARLLIVERLIPADGAPAGDAQFAALSDAVALAVSGGLERTLDEVGELLARAGLQLRRMLPIASGDGVVEAMRA